MVLLTSSTVSVVISTSVIGLFTFLLFLSGYVLQQQSVRSIQAALHPPTPQLHDAHQYPEGVPPRPIILGGEDDRNSGLRADTFDKRSEAEEDDVLNNSANKVAKRFGNPPDNATPNQEVLGSSKGAGGQGEPQLPNKYAYLQIISKPSVSSICSSLLLFKTLSSKAKDPTDAIFLYPKSWDVHSPTRDIASALSLLRDFGAVLHAVDMTDSRDRSPSDTRILSKASPKLSPYERIFYLRSPGLMLDPQKIEKALHLHTSDSHNIDDSGETIWFPTRLTNVRPDLPDLFLVASQQLPSGVNSLRPFSPDTDVMQRLVAPAPAAAAAHDANAAAAQPAYVYFQRDGRRKRDRETSYYKTWRTEIQEVCIGIDIND